jgi:hypothetical protein
MTTLGLYADVRQALLGDPVLAVRVSGIYADAAPESAAYPFVVVELAQVTPVRFLGNGEPIERVVVATRIVDTDLDRMAEIRERIDTVLSSFASGEAGQFLAVRKVTQRVDARLGAGTVERIDTAEYELMLVKP